MGAHAEIRLLGGFAVTVDGREVPVDAWRSRRAADLVKLLAISPTHSLHREQIMEALWPELAPDAAAANLRKAVHYARRAMGTEAAVEQVGALLHLASEASVEVDLERFEQQSADAIESQDADAAARVAEYFGGDLLPGDRYEPWAETARAKVRERYVALLHTAGLWERALELDPTDEAAHRALIKRHYEAGNRREAIRQFEHLRDALREHIGVGPDATTVALYEDVLAMEGQEPPSPSERAAALLANGLVAWGRRDLAGAERLAREARALARDAELGHELGESSTLLALIAYARGSWHDLFREEFADSVRRDAALEQAVYDSHLCFQEFYLYGPEGHEGANAFAAELLDIARKAGSLAGQTLAMLLRGEFALLSGDIDGAIEQIADATRLAEGAKCGSALSIGLERLAEAHVLRGDRGEALELLARAHPIAASSKIPSHLVIRLFGVQVLASTTVVESLRVVAEAERWMADAPRVCEPCSMTFRIEAARTYARAGDLPRARRHLDAAERITGLWQGGPWSAAIWEARAELRRAEGQVTQATALFLEAAGMFAVLHRPVDESRCRAAASA
jgi:DNA-binding SARP family transcriptional activator